ncbi:MAG: S1/P1 nuclease [Bacteriovorax sp.]|nr:S1/P1 nuclease [Bacteriovorax sp.]
MKKLLLITSLIMSFSPSAFSWGKTGHRIVGEIAQRNLDSNTLNAIKELAGEDDLSRISTWPDEIRSDPKMGYTSPWHYVSIPNGKTYYDQKRNKEGDLIEALYRFEDILRDTKETKEHKLDALKFLVHMTGDLHQPLHVGLAEDRGGNSIRVKWFKTETNLHTVWDEELIDFEKLSFTEYTNYLNHFSKEDKKSLEKGSFIDWANESQELRPKVYDFGGSSASVSLSYEYNYKVKPVIELRLKQAGLRLAYVLKKIFSQEKLTKDEIDLRKKIKENI